VSELWLQVQRDHRAIGVIGPLSAPRPLDRQVDLFIEPFANRALVGLIRVGQPLPPNQLSGLASNPPNEVALSTRRELQHQGATDNAIDAAGVLHVVEDHGQVLAGADELRLTAVEVTPGSSSSARP